MTTKSTIPPQPIEAAQSWSRAARQIATALILFHLAAVFLAPFAFACTTASGSSPFADGLMGWFRPYINAMYLNHGYAFFAPNPGPSHLVRYRIEFDDGREPIEGVFPDLKTQRPRLLYHRHFMLAESLYSLYTPPEEPDEIPLSPEFARNLSDAQRRAMEATIKQRHREQVALWKHSRRQYVALWSSLERHLRSVHGGDRITLTRVEHGQLPPDDFEVIGRLESPLTYRDLPEARPAPEVIRP